MHLIHQIWNGLSAASQLWTQTTDFSARTIFLHKFNVLTRSHRYSFPTMMVSLQVLHYPRKGKKERDGLHLRGISSKHNQAHQRTHRFRCFVTPSQLSRCSQIQTTLSSKTIKIWMQCRDLVKTTVHKLPSKPISVRTRTRCRLEIMRTKWKEMNFSLRVFPKETENSSLIIQDCFKSKAFLRFEHSFVSDAAFNYTASPQSKVVYDIGQ